MATRRDPSAPRATGRAWAVLGVLLGALLAFALYAPARWLAAALASWSDGHLQLVNARGTVWNGTAGVVFASGAGGVESISLPGTLAWSLRPRWDGVTAALAIPCCAPEPLQFRARPLANTTPAVPFQTVPRALTSCRWPSLQLARPAASQRAGA